jgi:MoxR-like ATPase
MSTEENHPIVVVPGFVPPNSKPDSNETILQFNQAKSIPNELSHKLDKIKVRFGEEFLEFTWLVSRKRWKLTTLVSKEDLVKEQKTYKEQSSKLSKISNNYTMASKVSTPASIARGVASEIRTINTGLMNKDEVFRMCALAETTGMCLLLVGPPGTGKTKTVIEYAKAWLNKDGKMTEKDFMEKLYILETDEGTKSSEVKGMPDLQELFENNKYQIQSPITEAEVIIINEIDKAGSNVRNSLLGIMNEKFLFHGKHKIPCKWKLFIATCNEIPKEEIGSPFWDRFMLKTNVARISAGEMLSYYSKGDKKYQELIKVPIPTQADMDRLHITTDKMDKFLSVGWGALSDRTLTFVPTFAKAASFIWNVPVEGALAKVASIMINNTAGADLANKLQSAEKKTLNTKIQTLHSMKTVEQVDNLLNDIEALMTSYSANGRITPEDVQEFNANIADVLSNHDVKKKEALLDEVLDGLDDVF